jgi:UDP-N-acetylglucosamine 2-epimerase (non-hydrolysing)
MIACVVGTRPEVIKMAPIIAALARRRIPHRVIATGQHKDWRMMGSFLAGFGVTVDDDLAVPTRDLLGSFVDITARLGALFAELKPRLVLAVGDTTTVVAAAFAARKTGGAFGHVEAGLRAFSRELPEEEHRICADALADLLFAPTQIAVANLTREHVNGRVLLTGNTVLDALIAHRPAPAAAREGVLVTVHRQETVDDARELAEVFAAIERLARDHVVLWPLHPRTRAKALEAGLELPRDVAITEPLGHVEFLDQLSRARLVVTDSGGVQEEAAILGTPCVTVRRHTERVETIEAGVGQLARPHTIVETAVAMLAAWPQYGRAVPELYGDGRAGDKIAHACGEWLAAAAQQRTELVA